MGFLTIYSGIFKNSLIEEFARRRENPDYRLNLVCFNAMME